MAPSSNPDLTYVIVAGGAGRRLGGTPKGLVSVGGQPIIERLLRQGERWMTYVVANRPRPYEFLDVPLVGDVFPGRGAPGGVVTALAVASTQWVLTVACDMPFVSREAMEVLLARCSPSADAVCFERSGRLEPLLAVYRRSLLKPWASRLATNPSLQQLLGSIRVEAVVPEEPRWLESINTFEDIDRLNALAGSKVRLP